MKQCIYKFVMVMVLVLTACSPVTPTMFTSPTATSTPVAMVTAIPVSTTDTLAVTSTSPVISATSQAVISVQDKASFVSETFPDNSVIAPGQAFTKTWTIKNTGSLIWTTAYRMVLFAAPQGDTLGAPAEINFTQSTPPGATMSLSLPMVAPATGGTYAVYWSIQNEQGETVAVDGGNLWVKIQVCESGQACNDPVAASGTTATIEGASVTVTHFTYDADSATVNYCIAVPNLPDWRYLREYRSWPSTPKLLVDQKPVPFLAGGSDYPSGNGCAYMQYQVGATEIEQAQQVTFVIDSLRMDLPPGEPDAACLSARPKLMTQYPGLDFQCHFSMAGFYTDLQVPSGMTRQQADQIIMDTIQGAIYGPWTLTIK